MARGTPDGNIADLGYATQISDPAYTPNMLWGFSPIDGAGRLIYLDTFNNGMGGLGSVNSGAGALPVLSSGALASFIYSPPNAIKLSPGVVANDVSGVFRQSYLGQNTRLGWEAGFVMHNTSPNIFMRLDYKPVVGSAYLPVLRFVHSSGKWQIDILGGGTQDVYTMGIPSPGTTILVQAKFVCDFSTGKYVRAFIGDLLFDLSAYSMPTSGTSFNGFLSASFRYYSYGAGGGDGYLGYILLTKDEP